MAEEEGQTDGRYNKGIAHHEFPSELSKPKTPEAEKAKDLLADIGFNLESTGNKIVLFANDEAAAKINSSGFKQAWIDAGGGMNVQDPYKGAHPGFNEFVINALADLSDTAIREGWTNATKKLAVFDLWGFVHTNDVTGDIPLQGTTAATFDAGWQHYKALDYRNIGNNTDKLNKINLDIANFNTAVIDTGADPYNPSAQTKYEFNQRLLSNLQNQLPPEKYQNALDLFTKSNGGAKASYNNASIISLVFDMKVQAGKPDINLTSIAEYASTKTLDFYLGKDGTWSIDKSTSLYEQLLETFKSVADEIPATLADFGKDFLTELARGAKNALLESGKLAPLLIVPFLNATYDSLKKAFATGDWTDFDNAATKFGKDVLLGGLMMVTSVAVAAAIPTVGTVLATAVAAGWAAFGLYAMATDGYQLIQKISADVGNIIVGVKHTIDEIQASIEQVKQIALIIDNAKKNGFEAPPFATQDQLLNVYLVDSEDPAKPDAIDGTAASEQFYGKNGAKVYAGDGNDEITFKNGYGEAYGEGGDDVLVAGNSRFIAAGQPLTPGVPDGPVAQTDLFQRLYGGDGKDIVVAVGGEKVVLDGGTGNDWVIASGGDKATTIGGLGRDVIYNTSTDGIIWGDIADSILDPGTDTRYTLDTSGPTPKKVYIADDGSNADNLSGPPARPSRIRNTTTS